MQPAQGQTAPDGFSVVEIQGVIAKKAVGLALLPDGRILIIHHQSGRVELIVDRVLKPEPLLVLDSLVTSSEQGLLGVAVDPDFPDSNYVYLFHTQSDNTNQVSRYTIEGALFDAGSDQLSIDPASKKKIFSAPDLTQFHNGGTLRFGSDKKLFISLGDDAYANNVQDLTNLYGKIFRLNRDGSVPEDNPVYPDQPAEQRSGIFAMGLRNPFRFSIDPLNDELFIGDVGTNLFEELNVARGGENFGYPHYEGPAFFRDYVSLIPPDPTFPAYTYPQSSNSSAAIAIATYRPKDFPFDMSFPEAYNGALFFVDYFDSTLKYLLRTDDGEYSLHSFGTGYTQLVDGAIAADGSLYVLSYGGHLWQIGYEGESSVGVDTESRLKSFTLHQNYPNPFRGNSTVTYELDRGDQVKVDVFDLLGRRVAHLVDAWQLPGSHAVTLDLGGLPGGVYVVQLQVGDVRDTKSVTFLGRQ